jgi:hypothetical protein
MGDQEPCLGAANGCLPVLRQAAASPEPGECSFDHPAPRQNLETSDGVGALDDLDPPIALALQGAAQLRPGIASVHCPAGEWHIRREGAKTWRNQGQLVRIERSTIGAPSAARQAFACKRREGRSCTLAG